MKIDFKWRFGDLVMIDELGVVGRVWGSGMYPDIQYKVRYFHNGEAKEVWFMECELSPARVDKK